MSAIAEELQLEREPQYREKIMPEAQLLEHPLNIIDGLQQAANEGIVPQVADAISLAHLPNPGFKITHEINPNAQIEPNDGKAAIVAGICGVTKSCEDRCCPIGDLDKARIRVGLINDLKLNDPNFFDNPNADKIIKDRVNEIMEQKQQLTSAEPSIESTSNTSNEKSTNVVATEQKKPKVEITTAFFGKQLSPEEAKQKMTELSGTYSQGKKIESAVTTSKVEQPAQTEPVATTQQKNEDPTPKIEASQEQKPIVPDHIREMMQARIKKPIETAPVQVESSQKQVEKTVSSAQLIIEQKVTVPQTEKHEYITPVPQERIDRHRPKAEPPKQSVEQTVRQPNSERPKEPQVKTPVIQPAVPKPDIQPTREKSQPVSLAETTIVDTKTPVQQTQSVPLSQKISLDSKMATSNSPIEHNITPSTESPKTINTMVPIESELQQPPKVIRLDSNMQVPQRETTTIQFEAPKLKKQTVEDIQLNEIPTEVVAQSPSPKQEIQRPEQVIQKTDVLIKQPDTQEVVVQQTEQSIQMPKLEVPQIQQKDFIPELTTIKFTQNAVTTEQRSVISVVESIQQEIQQPKPIIIGEQAIQQKQEVMQEVSVSTAEPTPEPQVHIQEIPQTVSINLQEIHNQTIVESTVAQEIKIQPPQIERQTANPVSTNNEVSKVIKDTDEVQIEVQINEIKVTETINEPEIATETVTESVETVTINELQNNTEQMVEQIKVETPKKTVVIETSVENPTEQSEIVVEPVTEDSFIKLLKTIISEQPEITVDETQDSEIESEVMEVSDVSTDELSITENLQEIIIQDKYQEIQTEVIMESNIDVEENTSEIPVKIDLTFNEESLPIHSIEEQPIIVVEATQEELPQIIAETLLETEFESEPVLILAIPENNEEIIEEIVTLGSSEKMIENTDGIQETPQQENFTLQFFDQEQVFNFMYLIQDITDLLSFFQEHNKQDDSFVDIDNSKKMDVTPEELKNDTFGKYDDTVIMTVWPIVQFMLFIQGMQMFIPQKQD